jgi:hypothetical protein
MTLDDIRARRWGFAVYALDPSDPVTLEVHVNGETYTWEGATVEACLASAFPQEAAMQEMSDISHKYKWSKGPIIATLELTPELIREAERLGLNVKPVVSTTPPGAVAAVPALPPPHDLREAGGVAETTGGVFD